MNINQVIQQVKQLPPAKQQVLASFVTFLTDTSVSSLAITSWTDEDFREFSLSQALREIHEEPELYSEQDLKERW